MSLHAISTEAQASIRQQQKKQAVSSAIISILLLTLILLLLSLFLLPRIQKEEVVIVTYSYEQQVEKKEKKVPKETVKKKPSPPSANISKVITSSVVSNINVPVPEVNVETPSFEFGAGDDFGSGWGSGSGGGGGGSASFFNTKMKADRVAYVIDYSASMRGKREQLMRTELARSVGELKGKIEYQLIFFAGPAWVAGDEIKGGKNDPTITSGDMDFQWITVGGAHGFKPKDEKNLQKPKWLKASSSQIKKSTELIEETKLVWGTTWEPAIDMALRMNPKPNVIFFMTDGSCGGNMVQLGEEIGKKAKAAGVIINTVAMMEPKTKTAMLKMSDESGGTFTLIKEDGKPYDKDGNPVKLKD